MPKITVKVPLRWGDMDAFGHVNNATTVQLLEQARVTGWFDGDREVRNLVVARHVIEYALPIPYSPDPIEVEMWLARIGGSSIDVNYELYSDIDGVSTLTTKAETVVVFLDDAVSGPRRLSVEERAAWSRYLDEPIRFRH